METAEDGPIDLSEHPKAAELFAYWDGKRAGRRAPARADIDPIEIPHLLPNLFIYQVSGDPPDYRLVLQGTALVQLFGADLTDKTFDEMFSGPEAAKTREIFDRVTATFEPDLTVQDARWIDREHVRYARLLLPLSDDGATVDRLMGGSFYDVPR